MSTYRITPLPAERYRDALALARESAALDGVMPLNEAARMALTSDDSAASHWAAFHGDTVVGYAQCADGEVQMVVHPHYRRQHIATDLARAIAGTADATPGETDVTDAQRETGEASTADAAHGDTDLADLTSHLAWWAFGNTPAAQAMARAHGLRPVRQLAIMEFTGPAPEPVDPPEGITFRAFTSQDAPEVVRVNAAAFAHHPEQGRMSLEDFQARCAQDWFRADDLLVATRSDASAAPETEPASQPAEPQPAESGSAESGSSDPHTPEHPTLLGFHWMKVESTPTGTLGEVYVIGVDPVAEGSGIGRGLLTCGLHHMLTTRGAERVILYVEASNHRVVEMYRRAGFCIMNTDVQYATPGAQHE